ncbi:hypothetical protein V8E36_001918 [Tilletia maclaganii]
MIRPDGSGSSSSSSRAPPSDLFLGVSSSSSIRNSPAELEDTFHDEQDLSDNDDDADGHSQFTSSSKPSSARPRTTAPAAGTSKARRNSKMTVEQFVELLQWLKRRRLALSSLLNALFPSEKPRHPYPHELRGDDASSLTGEPSTYSSHPHYANWRVSAWLNETGPQEILRRWKGMDDFATSHVVKINIKADSLLDYEQETAAKIIAEICPVLQRTLDSATGADECDDLSALPPRKRRKTRRVSDILESSEEEDASGGDGDQAYADSKAKHKRWKGRGQRSRKNISTMALQLILFGRSKQCNRFQQIMGLTLHAAATPKRPLDVLSRAVNHV